MATGKETYDGRGGVTVSPLDAVDCAGVSLTARAEGGGQVSVARGCPVGFEECTWWDPACGLGLVGDNSYGGSADPAKTASLDARAWIAAANVSHVPLSMPNWSLNRVSSFAGAAAGWAVSTTSFTCFRAATSVTLCTPLSFPCAIDPPMSLE